MALFTKSILAPSLPEDGLRISVMSRHTLNDGKTPHPDITDGLFDERLQMLAPPLELVGAFYKRGLAWDIFENRYRSFLQKNSQAKMVKDLAKRSVQQDITILCIEDNPDHCHRRILAEECKRVEPSLIIKVR